MLAVQFLAATLGAVCVILLMNNINLRHSLQKHSQLSARNVDEKAHQFTACQKQLETASQKAKLAVDHAIKLTQKSSDNEQERNTLKKQVAELQVKAKEEESLKKALKQAQEHEKDLESKLKQAQQDLQKAEEEAKKAKEEAKKAKKS